MIMDAITGNECLKDQSKGEDSGDGNNGVINVHDMEHLKISTTCTEMQLAVNDPVKVLPTDQSTLPSLAAMTNEQDGTEVLDIGEGYLVMRSDNMWYPATIIHHRSRTVAIVNSSCNVHYEYYVHYENFDRRLDEWVLSNRIKRSKPTSSTQRGIAVVHALNLGPLTNSMDNNTKIDFENKKMTRNLKRKLDEINHVQPKIAEMDPVSAALELAHEALTKVKNVDKVQLGCYEIDTWYFSPYPEKYREVSKLYICQFCLKYTISLATYKNHWDTCQERQPPGKEIYRKGAISIFEVDGLVDKVYCQNLCLLSKFFLDHKTVYFDVNPFLFYVLCVVHGDGARIVGYFSKEKNSLAGNNVACILILPQYQKQGYGKLLISLSYELSKREGKLGSPEKPISDLGRITYRSYWSWVLLEILCDHDRNNITINDLSLMTSIIPSDIISTLQGLNMIKYWKGKHVICVTPAAVEEYMMSGGIKKPKLVIFPEFLKWGPTFTPANKVKRRRRRKVVADPVE